MYVLQVRSISSVEVCLDSIQINPRTLICTNNKYVYDNFKFIIYKGWKIYENMKNKFYWYDEIKTI